MESIYWVVSRECNQECADCYNDSGPSAPGLTLEQASRCIEHFPVPGSIPLDRIILSGGEVLVWPELLYPTLELLYSRYGSATRLMVQTNGDLLDAPTLDRLLAAHVTRVDVSSMDEFHPRATLKNRDSLQELFVSRDMVEASTIDRNDGAMGKTPPRLFAFWGANPDTWIGPLWPRGRRASSIYPRRDRSIASVPTGAVRKGFSIIIAPAAR